MRENCSSALNGFKKPQSLHPTLSSNILGLNIDSKDLVNFATVSQGAFIDRNCDVTHKRYLEMGGLPVNTENPIFKIPCTMEDVDPYLSDKLSQFTAEALEGTCLYTDVAFPQNLAGPTRALPKETLHRILRDSVPGMSSEEDTCSFVERLASFIREESSSVTVKLPKTVMIEAVGVCLSPWDRYPLRDIIVEVGNVVYGPDLKTLREEGYRVDNRFRTDFVINMNTPARVPDIIIPFIKMRHHKKIIQNVWTSFPYRSANCVRLTFESSRPRVYFIYVLGTTINSLWRRHKWLIKRLALVRMNKASFLNSTELSRVKALFKEILKTRFDNVNDLTEMDILKLLGTGRSNWDPTLCYTLGKLATLECNPASKTQTTLALSPLLGEILRFF